MKIMIINFIKWEKSFKFKLVVISVLLCSCFISFYILNQPAVHWQQAGQWRIRVSQKADQIMSPSSPWLTINELSMNLSKNTGGPAVWCLRTHDINGNQLFPEIFSLLIYYTEDLNMINGYALDDQGQKVMTLEKFFSLSLYGQEFFSPQRKKYQNLSLLFHEQLKIELGKEKGSKTVWYDKNHLWWTDYKSDIPGIKAQLISEE